MSTNDGQFSTIGEPREETQGGGGGIVAGISAEAFLAEVEHDRAQGTGAEAVRGGAAPAPPFLPCSSVRTVAEDGSGVSVRRFSGAFRRMATPLWSRHFRVGTMSFGVTVKRVCTIQPRAFTTWRI